MNNFVKYLSIVITIIILVFFIILTFFIGTNSNIENLENLEKNKIGIINLEKNNKINLIEKNKILKDNISLLDFIYSLNLEKKYKKDLKNKIIEIYKGLYVFIFKEINNDFVIKSDFFEVKSIGTGMFFINNTDPKNIIIYNFSSILEINFIKDNKKIKKIIIYPHNFLAFSKNKVYTQTFEKGDFYRIKNFIEYHYINKLFFTKEDKQLFINNNFLETLKQNSYLKFQKIVKVEKKDYFKKQNNFLKQVFSDLKKLEKENKKNIEFLKNVKVINIFSKKFIEKYGYFFLNKRKIEVYKKNLILEKINNLFFLKEKNLKNLELEIEKELNKLREIDEKAYVQFKKIIKVYYSYLIYSNKINEQKNKNIFFDLINRLENKKISKKQLEKKQNYEKLNSIFHSLDFYKIDTISFINSFNDFSNNFLKFNKNNKDLTKYYSIFLFEFLKNNFSFDKQNIKSYINLLNIYANLKQDNFKDKEQLKQYIDFLNKIKIIIKSNFFLGRDNKNKLIFNKDNDLEIENIEYLQNIISNLTIYVNNNLDLLNIDNLKDKKLLEEFEKNDKILKEYIKALKDPEDYNNNFKENFVSILEKNNSSKNLSLKRCREYFEENFSNLNYKDFSCEIKNNYYIVKNLGFGDKKISFILKPYLGNTISNIVLKDSYGEKKLHISYNLDDRKEEYKLRNKQSFQNKKKIYFKDFFTNTFSEVKKIEEKIQKNNQKEEILKEDDIIIKLKRTKLLGEDGELTLLKNILVGLKYKNVIVKHSGDSFDVLLNKIPFYIFDKKTKINGFFTANYVLDKQKPYFKNISIIFTDKQSKELLDGNYLKIYPKIYYSDFDKKIRKIIKNYEMINYIYSRIKNIMKIKNVKIKYNDIIKTFEFSFDKNEKNKKNVDYKEKIVSIIVVEGKIKSIKNIYEELVKDSVKPDYKQIDIYLNTLLDNTY